MLREALGHNQSGFAKLVDISQPSLANYESGLRRVIFCACAFT